MIEFTAKKNQKVVKSILENVAGVSYSAVMKCLRKKDVKVNGKRLSEDVTVNAGDLITVYINELKPEFPVLFENDDILVVNKPSGYTSETLFNTLSQTKELYFIHRLDRNTSGIIIFAKNKTSESELLSGFKNHSFIKYYIAEVFGKPQKDADVLTAYLKKDSENSFVKIYSEKQKGAVLIKTGYELMSYSDGISKLKVRLYTGKTHQIRAHLAYLGLPIVGDGKYGDNAKNKAANAKTQRLTAYSLSLKFEDKSPLFYLDGKTFTVKEN